MSEVTTLTKQDKLNYMDDKLSKASTGGDSYEIPYGESPLKITISKDELKQYEETVIRVVDEFLRMELEGELTIDGLNKFHEYVNKRDEKPVGSKVPADRAVFYAFEEGGYMYKQPIVTALNKFGKLNGCKVSYNPTWLLVYLPVLQQAVYATAARGAGKFNDKDSFLSACWFLLRTILYIKVHN